MIINKSMFPVQTGFSAISKMNERMSTLQVQLATGEKAGSLAEMGTTRALSLSVRGRLSALEGFGNTIETVKLRLSVLDKAVSRLDTLEAETRTSATPSAYGTGDVNLGTVPKLSRARLDEVITLLNSSIDGRHLFAGEATQQKPVAAIGALLDGVGSKAGFKTVAAERRQADLGTSGLGRLVPSVLAEVVTLAEDGAHPFGLKLSTASTTSAGIGLTGPAGSPPGLDIDFNTQPLAGESVTLDFTLPDGTTESLTLEAVTGTAKPGEFAIGATETDTAIAFEAALRASVGQLATTKLASASTFASADNFFNAQGSPVMRVGGPPYSTATTLVPATGADTAQWYSGGASPDPRAAVTARVDDDTVINYGVQANETGIVQLVRTLATLAIESFPSSDPSAHARYDATASRNLSRLGENHNAEPSSLEMIGAELGMALSTTENTKERHTTYKGQMQSLLADAEQVADEDVAMEILALQTRLATSYQVTATVSQLSLVNFVRA